MLVAPKQGGGGLGSCNSPPLNLENVFGQGFRSPFSIPFAKGNFQSRHTNAFFSAAGVNS